MKTVQVIDPQVMAEITKAKDELLKQVEIIKESARIIKEYEQSLGK